MLADKGCGERVRLSARLDGKRIKMPEGREENDFEQVPIPLKNISLAIPKKESELKELIEDLTQMGCEGFLAKPWYLWSETTLRVFLLERGNQWLRIIQKGLGRSLRAFSEEGRRVGQAQRYFHYKNFFSGA